MADRFYRTKADHDEVQSALTFCASVDLTAALEAGVTLRDVVAQIETALRTAKGNGMGDWPMFRALDKAVSHFKEASNE